MATIHNVSPRQLYDMTYRLAGQRITVVTTTGASYTGLVGSTKWRGEAVPFINIAQDRIAFADIVSVNMGAES